MIHVGTWIFAALTVSLIAALWASGHKSIRDSGGYPDGWRHFAAGFYRWPWDKAFHAGGAFVGTLLGVYLFGGDPRIIAGLVMVAGLGVEFAEKWPKDDSVGRFSTTDLAADALGVALALAVVRIIAR